LGRKLGRRKPFPVALRKEEAKREFKKTVDFP
jgi:hypothetical protein